MVDWRDWFGALLSCAFGVLSVALLAPSASYFYALSAVVVMVIFRKWDDAPDRVFFTSVASLLGVITVLFVVPGLLHANQQQQQLHLHASVSSSAGSSAFPQLRDVALTEDKASVDAAQTEGGSALVLMHGESYLCDDVPPFSEHDLGRADFDPFLGGGAVVSVTAGSLLMRPNVLHYCEGGAPAYITFCLRGTKVFHEWTISIVNERTNETDSFVTHDLQSVKEGVAVVKRAVRRAGLYTFTEKGNEGETCPLFDLAGTTLVISHPPPSVTLSTPTCDDAFLVFSGEAPWNVTFSNPEDGSLYSVVVSGTSSFRLPDNLTNWNLVSVTDKFCQVDLDLPVRTPIRPVADVRVFGEAHPGNCINVTLVQGEPNSPVSLYYFKTNVSAAEEEVAFKRNGSLLITAYYARSDGLLHVADVQESHDGATSVLRPPGWLGASQPVDGSAAYRAAFVSLVPETYCPSSRVILGHHRMWRSFAAVEVRCVNSSSPSSALMTAYHSVSPAWNLLRFHVFKNTDEALARLQASSEPFSCFSRDERNGGQLDEESVSAPMVERWTSELKENVQDMLGGRALANFGLLSFARSSGEGGSTLFFKVHIGKGDAIFVKAFEGWDGALGVLAVRVGYRVEQPLFAFSCSNFLASHAPHALVEVPRAANVGLAVALEGSVVQQLQQCIGGSTGGLTLIGLASTQDESGAGIVFARFKGWDLKQWIVRVHEHREEGYVVVGFVEATADEPMYYFHKGMKSCLQRHSDFVYESADGDALDLDLLRLQGEVERRTGDRYFCLSAQTVRKEASGLLIVAATVDTNCVVRSGHLTTPSSSSNLEYVLLERVGHSVCITLEPSMCYKVIALRSEQNNCNGDVQPLSICTVALEGLREAPRRDVPTLHISGGGLIRRGESAKLIFHATGVEPFLVTVLRNGQFYRVFNMTGHVVTQMEALDGTFTLGSVVDASGAAAAVSGEATITYKSIPTARILALASPCVPPLAFSLEVNPRCSECILTWRGPDGATHESRIVNSATIDVKVQVPGVYALLSAKHVTSGEQLPIVSNPEVNLQLRTRPAVTVISSDRCKCADQAGTVEFVVAGSLPVTVTVAGPNGARSTHVLRTSRSQVAFGPPGQYHVVLAEDEFGCRSELNAEFRINNCAAPSCTLLNTREALYVGDQLRVSCKGQQAPFQVRYQVSSRWSTFVVNNDQQPFSFALADAGRHFFQHVTDANGCVGEVNVMVDVMELPTLRITAPPLILCKNAGPSFLQLVGSGNFPLIVSYVSGEGIPLNVSLMNDRPVALQLHGGGEHEYVFKRVIDANGRVGQVMQPSAFRPISKNAPHLSWGGAKTMVTTCWRPGMKNDTLPFSFSGEPPFEVDVVYNEEVPLDSANETYGIVKGSRQSSYTVRYTSANALLGLRGAGLYTITQVRDAFCSSRVRLEALVKRTPQPTALSHDQRICKGLQATFNFRISYGEPPFRLRYGNTLSPKETHELVVETRNGTMSVADEGVYFWTFVTDRNCAYIREAA